VALSLKVAEEPNRGIGSERRGYRLVRYADDLLILVKSAWLYLRSLGAPFS